MPMLLLAFLSRGIQSFILKSPIECNPCLFFPRLLNHFSECMSLTPSFFLPILAPVLCIIPFSKSAKMGLAAPPAWLPRCIIPEPRFAISAHSDAGIDGRPCLCAEFWLTCPACSCHDAFRLSHLAFSYSGFDPSDKWPPALFHTHTWRCLLGSNAALTLCRPFLIKILFPCKRAKNNCMSLPQPVQHGYVISVCIPHVQPTFTSLFKEPE